MKRVSAETLREKRPDEPLTRAEWNAVARASQSAGSGLGVAGDGGRMHQAASRRAVSRDITTTHGFGQFPSAVPRWSVLRITPSTAPQFVLQQWPQYPAQWPTGVPQGYWVTNGDSEIPAATASLTQRGTVEPLRPGELYQLRVTPTVADQPASGGRASPAADGYLHRDRHGEFVRFSAIRTESEAGEVAWFLYWPLEPRTKSTTLNAGASGLSADTQAPLIHGQITGDLVHTGDVVQSPGFGVPVTSVSPFTELEITEPGIYTLILSARMQASVPSGSVEDAIFRIRFDEDGASGYDTVSTVSGTQSHGSGSTELITLPISAVVALEAVAAGAIVQITAESSVDGSDAFASVTIQYHGRRESL